MWWGEVVLEEEHVMLEKGVYMWGEVMLEEEELFVFGEEYVRLNERNFMWCCRRDFFAVGEGT